MTKNNLPIPASFDAQVWADEWLKIIKEHPDVPTDRETMIGWFANALMRGYDEGLAKTFKDQRGEEENGYPSFSDGGMPLG